VHTRGTTSLYCLLSVSPPLSCVSPLSRPPCASCHLQAHALRPSRAALSGVLRTLSTAATATATLADLGLTSATSASVGPPCMQGAVRGACASHGISIPRRQRPSRCPRVDMRHEEEMGMGVLSASSALVFALRARAPVSHTAARPAPPSTLRYGVWRMGTAKLTGCHEMERTSRPELRGCTEPTHARGRWTSPQPTMPATEARERGSRDRAPIPAPPPHQSRRKRRIRLHVRLYLAEPAAATASASAFLRAS